MAWSSASTSDGTGFGLRESFVGAPSGTANHGVVFAETIVPKPGTFALLGLATLLLAVRRRNARA